MMKILIYDTILWIFGGLGQILIYLAGWRSLSRLGRSFGRIDYLVDCRKRETVREELTRLFGRRFDKGEINKITGKSFENYYKRQIETAFFGNLNGKDIEKLVDVEGLANIDEALARGKGVILLLSHFGSFLLPLPFLGYRGYDVSQVTGRQIHSSVLAERLWLWRKKGADRLPVNFIQVGRFLRPLYEALQQNRIVAIAFDGRDGKKWVEADFFERRALFSTGPFDLARRTGAAIVPTFIIRREDDTQHLVFEPLFEMSGDGDPREAVAADVRNYNKLFSRYIAEHPCHFGLLLYRLRQMEKEGTTTPFFAD